MTIRSVLIANRGEIACRVIATVQGLGLRAVAVFSDADRDAPHVALADTALHIGAGPASDSYLNGDRIIAAALQAGADAIHPGYGFLSENADFAQAVGAAGLVFIGPSAEAIRAMGNKAEAKRMMLVAGVPCVPGYQGTDQSDATLQAEAGQIGYPVMVKAAAGGGGRGMRRVECADDLGAALALAQSEARNAFGSDQLILEKAIDAPRHVEFQIMADSHGAVLHLGERDCSVQRRHQKVVEEAPCPVMTPDLRARMGEAAVLAARAVDYRGAGTVEFLLGADGAFYFLEMNTRLQVEHPVTEMITGLDLVALQIAVAQGDALPLTQDQVRLSGHAIEVRLYAEDAARDYLPVTGPVHLWRAATGPGVRVDAGIATGQQVSPYYDPMLAKIIAWGETRDSARKRLIRAVENTVVLGTITNSAFLAAVLDAEGFAAGTATTAFLADHMPGGFAQSDPDGREIAVAAALLCDQDLHAARARAGYVSADQVMWSSAALPPGEIMLSDGTNRHSLWVLASRAGWQIGVGEATFTVTLQGGGEGGLRAVVDGQGMDLVAYLDGDTVALAQGARRLHFTRLRAATVQDDGDSGGGITAPMPGMVVEVLVAPGDTVKKGQTVAVLEAMKMQHQITAGMDGTIHALHVAQGRQLASGDLMVEIVDGDESA